ncbi:MAG: ShlB/FhaC/HecB family hemolysin secretion/activation protein [Alphaproteobacteria bacterium]
MNHTFLRLVLASTLIAAFATPVYAQVTVPGSADPTRANDRFRVQERPPVEQEPVISVPDSEKKPVPPGGTTFVLKGIEFQDLTVFTQEELSDIYAGKIGQKITLAELNQIVAAVTARYRAAGYILSRAVLPPQRIGDGVVAIRIISGHVDQVTFQGLPEDSRLLNAYANKIRSAKPLDAATLERYLLLMEDLPGVQARAVIQPSASVSGASDVIVTITQKQLDAALTVDNRGSRFLGQYQGTLTLGANNVLGMHERTQFRGVLTADTDELRFGELSHEQYIGDEGTKAIFAASFTQTEPGASLDVFDIKGQNRFYSVAVVHPFERSRQSNLFGSLAFDYRDADVDILATKFYEDRLRVLRAGAAYDFVDDLLAINRMEATLSKGFGWDDNSSNTLRSRSVGKTSFEKLNLSASRLQPLDRWVDAPINLYMAAAGQVSDAPLLSAEEFGIGGPAFGSAYDSSEITGDHGAAARAELQYSDNLDEEYLRSYQIYTFYDIGKVWNRRTLPGESEHDSLSSAGIGVRFNLTENVSGELEVAQPLTRNVSANGADGDATRGFFSLTVRY